MSGDQKITCGIMTVVTALILLCFGGCYLGQSYRTSDGTRDCTIRKISHTGIVNKTWEVEAVDYDRFELHGNNRGSSVFNYTVSDPAVVEAIKALPPGQKVRLHYNKYLTTWEPNGETAFRVTKVETLR